MTVQAQRSVNGDTLLSPILTTRSAATFYDSVDTFVDGHRADYAVIDIVQGPAAATNTSAKWTSLALLHGTTTDVSNATAISGKYTGTTEATATTSQFVLPEHNDTSADSRIRLYVDCRNLERYIGVQGKADNSSNANYATAEFWRGDGMGNSAASRGVAVYSEG